MSIRRWRIVLTLCLLISSVGGISRPANGLVITIPTSWLQINPRATFYRTANDPLALNAEFVPLPEGWFGIPQRLTIQVEGNYSPNAVTGDTRKVLYGVFASGPSSLLATNVQNRVPLAVAANAPAFTGPTYHGALPTNISEDFRIEFDSAGFFFIQVPAGATHIALCVADSYYSDNSDPNGDFRVRLIP